MIPYTTQVLIESLKILDCMQIKVILFDIHQFAKCVGREERETGAGPPLRPQLQEGGGQLRPSAPGQMFSIINISKFSHSPKNKPF